jgi:hypothetical protein
VEGVTLYTAFIFDVLEQYEGMDTTCAPLFAMAQGLDKKNPAAPASMKLYNDVCTWIETHLGPKNIRRSGRAIGARAYDQMIKDKSLGPNPTPQAILHELKRVASLMIQDPKGRGWEILEMAQERALMRRTLNFNCFLQEGLLLSLVERTGVLNPQVVHRRCTRKGAEFCDYEIAWKPRL